MAANLSTTPRRASGVGVNSVPPKIVHCTRRPYSAIRPVGEPRNVLRVVCGSWIEPPVAPAVASVDARPAHRARSIAWRANHSEHADVIEAPFTQSGEIAAESLAIVLISPEGPEQRRPSREKRSTVIDKRMAVASHDATTRFLRLSATDSPTEPEHRLPRAITAPRPHIPDLDTMRFDIQDSERVHDGTPRTQTRTRRKPSFDCRRRVAGRHALRLHPLHGRPRAKSSTAFGASASVSSSCCAVGIPNGCAREGVVAVRRGERALQLSRSLRRLRHRRRHRQRHPLGPVASESAKAILVPPPAADRPPPFLRWCSRIFSTASASP